MPGKVQRLKLRLFVEGVEIPIISCQVQVNPNSPMVASIQIPPLSEATRFLPRSLVHVFFLDFYDEENPNIRSTSQPTTPGPSTYQKEVLDNDRLLIDEDQQRYKLLFVGELMGFQWTKNATNRSVVLQCSDPSNYWDYAYQFNNTDIFGPGMKSMFSGGSTNLFTDFLSTPGEAVTRIIMTPSERYPALRGLLGGVVHLLEAMGGSYYGDKKYAGQNVFFSLAELRLHLTQMITAYDKDPTAQKLLGGSADSLFGRSIGNLGEQASFRKVINMLIGVIFHETYGQPCPLYVPGTKGTISGFTRKKIGSVTSNGGASVFSSVVSDAEAMSRDIDDLLSFMDGYKANAPPAANVKDHAAYRKEHINTSLLKLGKMQTRCTEDARKVEAEVPQASRFNEQSLRDVAKQLASLLRTAATSFGKAASRLKTASNPSSKATTSGEIRNNIAQAKQALDKIPTLEVNIGNAKKVIPAQLKQQIFRPDVWFSAPPRCNVLFPDQYTSLSYARSFMQEPTRLMLKTNDEFFGEDELFDHFYFAPKAITVKQESNTLQALLRGDILDHELFTGILPVFEKMGEFNIFAARSGMVDGKTPKIGLAQRSTNFLYFKYRFAARQMQITGKFNPYIACGFPGLVIDKYVDLETLKLHKQLLASLPNPNGLPPPELMQLLGTHFLGSFTEVTHQIDQHQGTTLINCSYARQPEETVEFLGNVQQDVTITKTRPGSPATKVTTVASIFPPRVNSQGPNFGRIVTVQETTLRDTGNDFSTSKKLPVFGGPRDKKTKQLTVLVPVGFTAPASDYGKDVSDFVGDPGLLVLFRSYDITEEVSRDKVEKVDLPPEEYIRPGWYGDCWHPSKISDVYYDFFNTGAITEPQQVQRSSGGNDFVTSSDASRTLADMTSDKDPTVFAQDQLLALTLTKGASIQQAVTYLVLVYTALRQAGLDAEQFIRSYTWRPIATMLDMFGSSDLQLDKGGVEVVQGIEGFHSRAFGPYEDLFGLVTSDIESIVGIKKGSSQAHKADVRKRRYQAVLDYAAQLRLSRAILG